MLFSVNKFIFSSLDIRSNGGATVLHTSWTSG